MSINNIIQIKGRYILKARKANSEERLLAEFDNLILNTGLNILGTSSNYRSHCQVGTGKIEPLPTDTALTNLVLATSNVITPVAYNLESDNPYSLSSYSTFRFSPGTIDLDLTEIGVGWAASGSLFSKALIKDNLGNPTTVKLLADESLDVTYIVTLYPSLEDKVSTITLNGVDYQITVRPAKITDPSKWAVVIPYFVKENCLAYDGDIGPITSYPVSTTYATASTLVKATYISGTYYTDYTVRWNHTVANFTNGIKSILLDSNANNLGCYQIEIDPPIPKTDTQSFRLLFRLSWANKV